MHCHLRRWLSHWNGPANGVASESKCARSTLCRWTERRPRWHFLFSLAAAAAMLHAGMKRKKKQKQKVRSRQMRLQMALAFVQIGVWLAFRTCRATLFFCSNRNFRNWRNFLCVGLCSKPDLVEFRSLREALRCTTNCASNWHDDWTFRRMTSYMTERLLLTFDL